MESKTNNKYPRVYISFQLSEEANRLLTESSKRSGRKKLPEAALRLEDHLRRFRSIKQLPMNKKNWMCIMAVLRIQKKQNNFVVLDKTCLNDEKLSWGAKGLHAFLISLPDDWEVRVRDLQKRSTNGRDAVRAFLSELGRAGYIKKAPKRNDETGRFGGLEYLVLETPESDLQLSLPETENPFAVENEEESPKTENPSPVSPAPGNPTQLNNNRININKINNKTAADNPSDGLEDSEKEENAAAVIFSQNKNTEPSNKIYVLSQDDALIGAELTINQARRAQGLIAKLPVEDKDAMFDEISFCLLNKTQFTGCGNDFSKKLNAIRSVILRGDWQTPAGMVEKNSSREQPSGLNQLEQRLREAKADEIHFSRLLSMAKEGAKSQLNEFVQKAQQKVNEIENSMNELVGTGTLESISSGILKSLCNKSVSN